MLLLVPGLAPVAIFAAAAHLAPSLAAVSSPAAIGGLLYLLAAVADRRHQAPGPRRMISRRARRGGG